MRDLCFLLLLIQSNPRFSVWPFNEVYVWFFKNFLGGFIFWNAFHSRPTTQSVWRRRFVCVAEIFAGKSASVCCRSWRVSFVLDFFLVFFVVLRIYANLFVCINFLSLLCCVKNSLGYFFCMVLMLFWAKCVLVIFWTFKYFFVVWVLMFFEYFGVGYILCS